MLVQSRPSTSRVHIHVVQTLCRHSDACGNEGDAQDTVHHSKSGRHPAGHFRRVHDGKAKTGAVQEAKEGLQLVRSHGGASAWTHIGEHVFAKGLSESVNPNPHGMGGRLARCCCSGLGGRRSFACYRCHTLTPSAAASFGADGCSAAHSCCPALCDSTYLYLGHLYSSLSWLWRTQGQQRSSAASAAAEGGGRAGCRARTGRLCCCQGTRG